MREAGDLLVGLLVSDAIELQETRLIGAKSRLTYTKHATRPCGLCKFSRTH